MTHRRTPSWVSCQGSAYGVELFALGGRECWGRGTFEMISIRFLVPRMCSARIRAIARDSMEPIGNSVIYTPSGKTVWTASSRVMPCGTQAVRVAGRLPGFGLCWYLYGRCQV
jgi:hypothetical protein